MIDKINAWYDGIEEPWRILLMFALGSLAIALIVNPYTVVLGILLIAAVLYIRYHAPHTR